MEEDEVEQEAISESEEDNDLENSDGEEDI